MQLHPIRTLSLALLTTLLALTACRSTPPVSTVEPRRDNTSSMPSPGFEQPRPSRQRRAPRNQGAADSIPGQFDFYLLNLSWSPEFCHSHPTSPECTAHPGFVVHGLWPQNNDGTYPEDCSDAPGPPNPQSDTDLMPTAALVEHEWQTHGTCSGLNATTYFNTVRNAFHEVTIPASLRSVNAPLTLTPDDIINQFAQANPSFPPASFALSCGNNYLTAIQICFSKDLGPQACQNVRTCRANIVRVTPE